MLSNEDNAVLTRTDADQPMGAFMRRFWIPFLLSSELPERDGAQVRVRLLGENLIAYRDTDGAIGLLDEACPHRRASLFFGRNEECGLRCAYHGWKFDREGRCVDMPTEPAGSELRARVKIKAYPVREAGGVAWAYLGPAGLAGEIPDFEWMDVPDSHRYQSRWVQDCNYFQALEGEIDSAHVSFLHRRFDVKNLPKTSILGEYFTRDTAPQWSFDPKPYGMVLAARRAAENGGGYWRMNQFLVPFYTMIAPEPGGVITARIWVPVDDEHCLVIATTYRNDQPLTQKELLAFKRGEAGHALLIPGTTRPVANRDNDYLIDRDLQRSAHFSGIRGIRAQDAAMSESAGAIADRSKEFLGTSDQAIVRARRIMVQGARRYAEGETHPGMAGGALYRVRSWSAVLPEGMDYKDDPAVRQALRAGRAEEAVPAE